MSAKDDLVQLVAAALPLVAERVPSAQWEKWRNDVATSAVDLAQTAYEELHRSMNEHRKPPPPDGVLDNMS